MDEKRVVAVTDREYAKAAGVFESAAAEGILCVSVPQEEEACVRAIHEHKAEHAIVGAAVYAGPLYDALPAGSVLARFGVGYDGIDLARATGRGLLCTNTPGVLDISVAEQTIGLLLAAARTLPALDAATKAGEWPGGVGMELRGKRLAIIGCGPIGCQTARIAAHGLGMCVTGCKRQESDAHALCDEFGFERIVYDYAEAVAGADFVSLHIPATGENRRYINAERLAMLPAGAWLINTARGAVLDEAPLYDALASRALRGAALDVFEQEPYVPAAPDKDLRTLSNVILTPHTGSATHEACERMALGALRNIRLALEGSFGKMDLLNPEVLRPGRNNTEQSPTLAFD